MKKEGKKKKRNLNKRALLALAMLLLALIAFSIYFFMFYGKPCKDVECFIEARDNCQIVSWIKEDAQASWVFTIKGNAEGDFCKVNVRLLQLKQGTTDSEKLQDKEMLCITPKSEIQFPEKDLSRCSGVLKEELQDLIIRRMHNYLLKNLGDIQEEFSGL